jgi:hypothetical protein
MTLATAFLVGVDRNRACQLAQVLSMLFSHRLNSACAQPQLKAALIHVPLHYSAVRMPIWHVMHSASRVVLVVVCSQQNAQLKVLRKSATIGTKPLNPTGILASQKFCSI